MNLLEIAEENIRKAELAAKEADRAFEAGMNKLASTQMIKAFALLEGALSELKLFIRDKKDVK